MKDISEESESVLGVGWYRREQWALLLSSSADRDELEDTYDEWLTSAEKTVAELQATGANPRKIDIDMEEMISWAQGKGVRLDGDARSEFIAIQTRENDLAGE